MAKFLKNGKLSGLLGDFRIYELNGQTIISKKGGPSKEQILKSKNYAHLRLHHSEFRLQGKISGYIKRGVPEIKNLWTLKSFNELQSRLIQLYKMDQTGDLGQRGFYFSRFHFCFANLDITNIVYLNFLFPFPIFSLDPIERASISIKFSDQFKLMFPKGYEYANIRFIIQRVQDIVFDTVLKTYLLPSTSFFDSITQKDILNINKFNNISGKLINIKLSGRLETNEALFAYILIDFSSSNSRYKEGLFYAGLMSTIS